MANLLDKLRETQTQRAQAPVGGQTRRLEQALTQRATGRGFGSRGPRASGVTERAALGEQAALADQQQAQAQQAAEGLQVQQAGQEQQYQQATQELSRQQQQQFTQFNRQVEETANNLKRKDLARATDKDMFDLAMLGSAQALQDKEYMDNLNREGRTRRLDDSSEFKKELQQSIFADQLDVFTDQQQFQKMLDADDDKYRREIAKIDIATAKALVDNDIKMMTDQARWGGIASTVSGITQLGAQYAASDSSKGGTPGGSGGSAKTQQPYRGID